MTNKSLIALTAAAGLFGTVAAADSYFTYIDNAPQQADAVIELGEVVADSAGTVVIYDYNGGEFGEILGSVEVGAGANTDVEVNVGARPLFDVAAVLYLGEPTTPDMAAAWVEIELMDMGMDGDETGDTTANN
ncbi:hypothetical protein OG2516_02079 [Oceanicola granulosus HTCC2516]|uniref:Uncharacterized protein n=1 Tax=Oceanicola granulosus (strain ATCC BAA-861 / DSM 15982 / KCTC 12143 / HTCC2516) TaxID=314256 RepID=Q2CHV8_OCEGH|nr:hypothetical protein [Oceanicola granulosus]EAR52186.1 hypothetical protein OG2516_02079 [Oceanicola granulosus HTCC2516]